MGDKLNPTGGTRFSPRPAQNSALTVYASGNAYSLTATPALLNLATTPASIILTDPGTYLIIPRVRIDYNGSTFAAVRTVTLKLRRTNNTATDITNGSTSFLTQIITALTFTAFDGNLPFVIYTTQNSNDTLQIFGDVNVAPTAGSIDAVEASILAIKLS